MADFLEMLRPPFLLLVVALLGAAFTSAATITVANVNDTGPGSLRAAIASAATSGDTIDFNLTYPATIVLASELASGNKSLVINGPGPDQLTISGNSAVRVFHFNPSNNQSSTISGLTIANGNPGGMGGGAILVEFGGLALVNCVVTNSTATLGGGIATGANTRLSVIDTVISNNTASVGGGGVTLANGGGEGTFARVTVSGNKSTGPQGGGGIYVLPSTSLNMANCHITGNSISAGLGGGINNLSSLAMQGGSIDSNLVTNNAGSGGGISSTNNCTLTEVTISGNNVPGTQTHGGGIDATGALTIQRCTISGNSVGGIVTTFPVGGAGINASGTISVSNSTISGNSVTTSNGNGALCIGNNSTVTLNSCTIAYNSSANTTGGVTNSGSNSTVTCRNNLIAQNTNSSLTQFGPDVIGPFVTAGYNLVGDARPSGGFTNGFNFDKIGSNGAATINALLNPLADNGGPTKTHALQLTSPAIDSGNPSLGLTTDQRGFPRFTKANVATIPGSNNTDIGAFEYGNTALRITSINRPADGSIILEGVGLPNALHSVRAVAMLGTSFSGIASVFSDASGNLYYQDNDAIPLLERFYRFTYP